MDVELGHEITGSTRAPVGPKRLQVPTTTRDGQKIPSGEQLRAAIATATSCYGPRGGGGRLFLVPASGDEEALVCMAAALVRLPCNASGEVPGCDDRGEIVVLGTNEDGQHFTSQLGTQLAHRNQASLLIPSLMLYELGWSCSYAQLDQRSKPEQVVVALVEWLSMEPTRILVCACNLSEMRSNPERVLQAEDPLITALLKGRPGDVGRVLTDVTEPGMVIGSRSTLELQVLALLVERLHLQGRVVCYSDTGGSKRLGWSDRDGDLTTSYLGAVWSEAPTATPGTRLPITSWDRQQLVAYARSVVASVVLETDLPTLPSWSPWYQRTNGVFIGVTDEDGEVMASVGSYEDTREETTLPENVTRAAVRVPGDAAERWEKPLDESNVWSVDIDVKVLQPAAEWVTYTPAQLLRLRLTPEDNYGFYLQLGERSATYLPAVWDHLTKQYLESGMEAPGLEQLLTMLSTKAGMRGDAWMGPGVRVSLYTTITMVLCGRG